MHRTTRAPKGERADPEDNRSARGLAPRAIKRERSAPARSTAGLETGAGVRGADVSVVIPALNEADSIGWVFGRIPEWVREVVLVDGLSIDHTEGVARELRPDLVVVHQHDRGKGSALRAGFAAARGEFIVMIDADGSTDPAEMHRFVDALSDGADFVKGSRYLPGGGSEDLTRMRSVGNRALARLANLLYGSRFTDLCYGYCAFHRRHLDSLALTATGFEIETELALSAVKAGLEIREVPSFERSRRAGVSNLKAFRDGRRVLSTMMAERRTQPAGAQSSGAAIRLTPRHVTPVHAQPRPAPGCERRRGERRGLEGALVGYSGPERRREQRRRGPGDRELVYVASEVLRPVAQLASPVA